MPIWEFHHVGVGEVLTLQTSIGECAVDAFDLVVTEVDHESIWAQCEFWPGAERLYRIERNTGAVFIQKDTGERRSFFQRVHRVKVGFPMGKVEDAVA